MKSKASKNVEIALDLSKKETWKAYQNSLSSPLAANIKEIKLVVLDTETTGFDPKKDRVLSIGALTLEGGQIEVKEAFEIYLHQDRFSEKAAEVHGILKKSIHPCVEEEQAMIALLGYLKGAVLVAHHANFDISMLNNTLYRSGFPPLKNKVIDTCALYYNLLPRAERKKGARHRTLDELADQFAISKEDRHTALGDALITARLLLRLLSRAKLHQTKTLLKWGRFHWYR